MCGDINKREPTKVQATKIKINKLNSIKNVKLVCVKDEGPRMKRQPGGYKSIYKSYI